MSAAILGLELRFRARAVASAALGLVALTALVGSLYPSLGDSIADVEIPKEIGDFIGGGDLATIQGWLRAEIMAVYGPVVFAVIAITSATATTAGEEEGHVFALVLAKPVPRRRLLLAKAAAIALLLGALSVAVLVGLRIAVAIAGGGVATAHLAAASLHLLAFGLGSARSRSPSAPGRVSAASQRGWPPASRWSCTSSTASRRCPTRRRGSAT